MKYAFYLENSLKYGSWNFIIQLHDWKKKIPQMGIYKLYIYYWPNTNMQAYI